MDQAAREGGPAMSAAADETGGQKSPDELRQEIEQTREELGDTVEALAEKTDVKSQAKNRMAAVKESARQKVSQAAQASPDSASAGAQQVASTVQGKPLPFAAGGAFAAGVMVGWLVGRR